MTHMYLAQEWFKILDSRIILEMNNLQMRDFQIVIRKTLLKIHQKKGSKKVNSIVKVKKKIVKQNHIQKFFKWIT
jgi:hypothetical protein